jgi:anionic cell wall polymer biosynthesis LytR-Cps2A-Psr (LCP) family protein
MIDFEGFVSLTQDLDGVIVPNPIAFTSQGYNFPAGNITLEGKAALVFVRERHAFGARGELVRSQNQRNMLKGILAKGLSPEVISDPFQFTDFLGNAAKRITVDKSLTNAELRATAASLRMKPSGITLISAPLGKERRIKGERVHTVDRARLAELSQALRSDTMAEYVKKHPE